MAALRRRDTSRHHRQHPESKRPARGLVLRRGVTRLRSGLDVVALSNGEELHYQGISNAGVPVRTVQAFVRSGQAERQVLMLVLERRRKLTFDQVYDTIGLGTPEHCIAPLEHIRRFGQDA